MLKRISSHINLFHKSLEPAGPKQSFLINASSLLTIPAPLCWVGLAF